MAAAYLYRHNIRLPLYSTCAAWASSRWKPQSRHLVWFWRRIILWPCIEDDFFHPTDLAIMGGEYNVMNPLMFTRMLLLSGSIEWSWVGLVPGRDDNHHWVWQRISNNIPWSSLWHFLRFKFFVICCDPTDELVLLKNSALRIWTSFQKWMKVTCFHAVHLNPVPTSRCFQQLFFSLLRCCGM